MDFQDENLRNPWHITIVEDTKVMEFWVKLWVNILFNVPFNFWVICKICLTNGHPTMDFQDENLRNPWHITIVKDTKVMGFWVSFWVKLWLKFWVNLSVQFFG